MTPQLSLPPGGKIKISLPLAVLLLLGFTGGGAGGYGLLDDFFSVKNTVEAHDKRLELVEKNMKELSEEIKASRKSVQALTDAQLETIGLLQEVNKQLGHISRCRR